MSYEEFITWIAYFNLKAENEEAAVAKEKIKNNMDKNKISRSF